MVSIPPSGGVADVAAPTLSLPHWLWGSNIRGFAEAARWHLTEVDRGRGEWKVRLEEKYVRRRPRLIQTSLVADTATVDSPGTYAPFESLPPYDHLVANEVRQKVQGELDRLAENENGLGPALYAAGLATMTASQAQLPEVVKSIMNDQLLRLLPDSSVWLINVDSALTYRFVMTRVLLQVEEDPALLQTPAEDFAGFNSARGLFSDTTLGLYAYLAPLFLSLTPSVWGFGVPRGGGVVVYQFGRTVPGRRGHATEPLQLFHPSGSGVRGTAHHEGRSDFEAALRWWCAQLDLLFSEVTDPANYMDENGRFVVRRQFEALLSLEQAFRNVQSSSALDRDPHARRVLLFDTLDTFEGMKQLSFHEMCRLSVARRELEALEEQLPADAARVLLPRARRAVEALAEVQQGFFLPSRLAEGGLRVPDRSGHESVVSLETAASSWLRVLRNAGHAFGGRDHTGRSRDEALLLSHDAKVPDGVADLSYLYLVRLLARPELISRGRRRGR